MPVSVAYCIAIGDLDYQVRYLSLAELVQSIKPNVFISLLSLPSMCGIVFKTINITLCFATGKGCQSMQQILRVERQFLKPELNSLLHAIQVLFGSCFVFNVEFNSALARLENVLRGMS